MILEHNGHNGHHGQKGKRSHLVWMFVVSVVSAVFMVAVVPRAFQSSDQRTPTYNADIAPLVNDRCALCHHPGGSAPFPLLSYADVKRRAAQIAAVTRRRYMPPWKVEPGFGPFVGQHPLSDDEIDRLQRWVDAGAPEGDGPAPPVVKTWTEGWQLGTPDMVVTLERPYSLQADGTDVFRIFVLPVPVTTLRYVRGLEFLPGNARVVHHANIRVDRTPASRALDAADPAPGYTGLILRSAEYPDGHFLGWTPGQVAPLLPDDLAWRLDAKTDLVVEVHMQPSGRPELVRPSIGLYFGRRPPTRTPAMLRLGRQTIDIPAGDSRYIITDSYRLPVDVEVLALQPHAHYRARDIRGDAALPDGRAVPLIAIRDWDFRWQHVYRFVTPLRLPKGTVLSMTYTYDNSEANARNPERPPKRARWGQRSSDEMGDLWIQVLTRSDADLATLETEFRRKVAAEDVNGYEMEIERHPDDPGLRDTAAMLYLELGRGEQAVDHFRASAALRPQSAQAHYNLGTALTVARQLDAAAAEYRTALGLDPAYANAHNNLGNVLLAEGRAADAIAEFRESARLQPKSASALANLAAAYAAANQYDRAIETAEAALRLSPDEALAATLRASVDRYRRGRR
jgi:Flp pilus assembly protein TadD/mono/diheme cytochrome c family protein